MLALIAVFVTTGAIIALMVVLIRKSTRRQREIAGVAETFIAQVNQLGGRREDDPDPRRARRGMKHWHIERGESEFIAQQRSYKNNHGYWLSCRVRATAGGTISAPFRAPGGETVLERMPRIRLRPETRRDTWGKRLRLNREVQTGDDAFDAAVYIESDASDDDVMAVLSSPRLREAVLALFQLGCDEVGINYQERHVAAGWRHITRGDVFADGVVERALEQVGAIRSELPGFASVAFDTSWPRGAGFMIAAATMAMLGFIVLTWGLAAYQPLGNKAAVGFAIVTATPAFVLSCWLHVRKSSAALRAFAWSAGMALVGVPVTVGGAVFLLNGALDSKRYEQRVTVLQRWISKSDDSKSYYIYASPWPPHEKPVKIQVERDEYAKLLVRKQATLRLGPGALGIEWFDGVVAYQ